MYLGRLMGNWIGRVDNRTAWSCLLHGCVLGCGREGGGERMCSGWGLGEGFGVCVGGGRRSRGMCGGKGGGGYLAEHQGLFQRAVNGPGLHSRSCAAVSHQSTATSSSAHQASLDILARGPWTRLCWQGCAGVAWWAAGGGRLPVCAMHVQQELLPW
jgi:hypothetical protein